jgi:hypothetical protein
MYVFLQKEELQNKKYLKDIDMVANTGTFDFLFLTQRGGANFYDFDKMHPIFRELVTYAHERGLKVGLQLWPKSTEVPDDSLQGIVVEHELTLDSHGRAEYTGSSHGVRRGGSGRPMFAGVRSELLRIYAFRKAGNSEYQPGSVVDITDRAKVTAIDEQSLSVSIEAPQLAGYNVYAMTVHYHQYPDLFSKFLPSAFAQALSAYRDVHFDGAALDEFRYMALDNSSDAVFRERLYSPHMAAYYRRLTGQNLARALFDMRYSPAGDPVSRIRAINNYFEVLRQGPLMVERAFYDSTVQTFGR